jgi:hypothetical protein
MFGRAEAETGSASSRKQIDYLPDEVAPYAKLSLNKDALVGIDGTIPPESSANLTLGLLPACP